MPFARCPMRLWGKKMPEKYDILIHKGLVVTGSGVRKADVGIKGEKIVAVKPGLLEKEARRAINASGKYIMPGVIDVHVHPVYEDDLGGLSYTAAFGGTTTLIHFAYAKLKWMTDDYHLTAAMDLISNGGGLAMVHAENGLVTDYLEDRSLKRGEDQKKVFLKTRPDLLEAEAIFRALTIASITRCPLYIVHLSTEKGVIPIQRAKEEGQRVYVETCPQYLTMTDAKLQKLGPLAKIGPPLRSEKDRLALWKAIQRGLIDVVASDHAPKAKKLDDPFFEAPYGSPQSETMLTVTYDEGVNKKRIKLNKLVRLFSENPAKIFGLYPKKGTIQNGSDADLVIFDPKHAYTIKHENQHSGAPYTLYEGRKCLGKPVLTMQRGKILVEDGEMKGRPGEGKFLPTKTAKGR